MADTDYKKIEDYSLWHKYKEENDLKAREKLIEKHLSLVKYQAGRIKMVIPDFIEVDDLESVGVLGLLDAFSKFDYQLGIKFSTYASRRVRGEIIDYLRKLDWLPHNIRREGKRIKQAEEELTRKLGHKPSAQEITQKTGLEAYRIKEVKKRIESANWVSIYQFLGEDQQILDTLQDTPTKEPDQVYQQEESLEVLATAIARLSEQEKIVVSLYYYEEVTQQEIAEILDLTPARISQIHKKAVNRLRGFLSRKKGQFL